jgi:hypothetical protein
MPPFLQFRLWLRESPVSERVLAGLAALIALVLVVVALVPVAQRDDGDLKLGAAGDRLTSATTLAVGADDAPAGDMPVTETGGTPVTRTRTESPSGTPGSSGAGTVECAGLAASGPGVTASEVLMDVSLISLAGPIGNSQFDIRPDLRDIANALADEVNKTGGLACGRKLRIKVYDVNPLDTNDAQAKCLKMVEDKPYIVLDFGGYLGQATRACFVQNKLPIISSVAFDAAEFKSAFPYVLSPRNLAEDQARNGIFGLKDRGFFAAPKFKKVGLLVENCIPAVAKLIDEFLAQAGVKPAQISKFTLDCNPASANNQIAQAVLQHKADGATHVIFAAANNNAQNYTRIASTQGFHPLYGISDLGEGVTPSGAKNWDSSFDGAVGITSTHTGETFSGMRNAKVDQCDQIMKRHGVPGFTTEAKDLALLGLCDLFDFMRAAINKAGANPVRTSFATGITKIGQFVTAYAGDGVFNRADKYKGGDFQRAIQYHSDCVCWKVKDAFAPAYPG